jgi:hypothetical protein
MVWIHGGGFTTGSGNFESDIYGDPAYYFISGRMLGLNE